MKLLKALTLLLMFHLVALSVSAQLIVDFNTNSLTSQPLTAGCIPTVIQFMDKSTMNGNPVPYLNGGAFNSHHWDFNYNGQTSNAQNPVYGYSVRATSVSP